MSNFICFLILGIEGCCWTSTTNDYMHILLLDPCLAECPVKLPLSVCPSVSSAFFLRNSSLVFSDFWHNIKRQSFYKLVLSFLLEVARLVQNTQNRKLVIFLQYIKKKFSQLLCVLLWCKTFRYFTGVQSCSLLHVIMTISLRKLQSSVWYGRTAKIQKLQILQIYPKYYCTFNILLSRV